jgi:MFS family permease
LASEDTLAESHCSENKTTTPQFVEGPIPLKELFKSPILIPIANYGSLAFLEMGFSALLPLFYSVPVELGGLSLSTPIIGLCLGAFGLANGIIQALFFAKLIDIWGPKRIYMAGVTGYLVIFAMFPIIHFSVRQWGFSPFIWLLVGFQLCVEIIVVMGFGETILFECHIYIWN